MVKAFLAERCVQANSKAWQLLTHNGQSEGGLKATRAARDNGVTHVLKHVNGSISVLDLCAACEWVRRPGGMWNGLSRALELLVKRVARYADCCLLHLS